MKITRIIISLLFLCCNVVAFSQKENDDIKKGNEYYDQKNYKSAEDQYRNALKKNEHSYGANYNLGNVLYQQEKYKEAIEQYQIADTKLTEDDKPEKAAVAHNLGNAFLKEKKYGESVNAYKQALRYNPNDEDSRYNLAYAKQMLVQQQQQPQPDQNQNQDNNQQQQPKKPQEDKQPEPQNDQNMSKENAEQILKAIEEDEKNIQEKIKLKEKKETKRRNVEKEW